MHARDSGPTVTDLGDLLGLGPAPARPSRARTRCADCHRPVYVDQLVCGLGRCCAERAGLIVRRYRIAAGPQAGETLLDHLPAKESGVEPYPQIRIDVTDLDPDTAHRKIVEHVRAQISDPTGEIAAAYPHGITAACDDTFRGLVAILERHAPYTIVRGTRRVPICGGDGPWPCPDYRDAAVGLATGLPVPGQPSDDDPDVETLHDALEHPGPAADCTRAHGISTDLPRRELAEPDAGAAVPEPEDPHAGTIAAV